MKKILAVLTVISVFALLPLAKAEDDTTTATPTTTTVPSITKDVETDQAGADNELKSYNAARSEDKQTLLVTYGDKVVAVRQKALTELQKRFTTGDCSTINATVKNLALADITAVQTSLASQKAAIDSSTALTTTKPAVKAVFTGDRVFMRFVPAVNGMCASERIIDLVTGTKLTNALAELTKNGVDTTTIQTNLTTAKTSAQAALTIFEAIAANPGDTNTNSGTQIAAAKQDLGAARAALAKVKTAIDQAIDTLNKSADTTTTPTTAQ